MTSPTEPPSDDRLVEGLNRFLATDWRHVRSVIEAEANILLHPHAESVVRSAAAAALENGKNAEADRCRAYAELLSFCRERGVDAVFSALNQGRGSNEPRRSLAEALHELRTLDAALDTADLAVLQRQVALSEDLLIRLSGPSHAQTMAVVQGLMANALHRQARLSKDAVLFERAASAYRLCLRGLPRRSARLLRADTQADMGHVLQNLGELTMSPRAFRRAADMYVAALRARRKDKSPTIWASLQINLGNVLRRRGDILVDPELLARAAAAYHAALEVPFRAHAPRDWATVHHHLADVLISIGEITADGASLRDAIRACRMASRERKRKTMPLEWAATQVHLGNALWLLAKLEGDRNGLRRAERVFIAVQRVFTRKRTPLYWAMAKNNQGNVLQDLGTLTRDPEVFARAEVAYRAALRERTREVVAADWAVTQNNLGVSLGAWAELTGDMAVMKLAEAAYAEAVLEFRKTASPMKWALIQGNLGNLWATIGRKNKDPGRLRKAVVAFQQSSRMYAKRRAWRDWGRIQNSLGAVYQALAAIDGDRRFLELAEAAYRDALNAHQAGSAEDRQQNIASSLAHLLVELDRFADAIEIIEPALALSAVVVLEVGAGSERRARAVEIVGELYGLLGLCRLRLPKPDVFGALSAAEAGQARLLANAMGLDETSSRAIPDGDRRLEFLDAVRQRNRLQERVLRWALVPSAAGSNAYRRLQVEARHAASRVASQIETHSPIRTPDPVGRDAAAAGAPHGGVLVMVVVTAKAAFALVVARDHLEPTVIDLPELARPALSARLSTRNGWFKEYFGYVHDRPESTTARPVGAEIVWHNELNSITAWLWQVLCSPLDTHLRAIGLARHSPVVMVVPGLLRLLPIHAAGPHADGTRFIDRWTLSFAPSLRTLAACQQRSADNRAATALLAVLNPAEDPRLKGAELEAPVLDRRFATAVRSILLHREGTTAAVANGLSRATHIHISAHGSFDWQHPERSRIELADGDMTLVSLAGSRSEPWRLVFLSACESGVTDIFYNPEESIGWRGAFIEAGAACVVASLWPVRDDAAFLLCSRFYEFHLDEECRERMSPAAALRKAQIWLRGLTFRRLREMFPVIERPDGAFLKLHAARRFRPRASSATADDPNRSIFLLRLGLDEEQPYLNAHYWASFVVTGA